MTTCLECVKCAECGHPAYCLSDRPDSYPCPHGEPLCGDCLDACEECLVLVLGELIGSEPPC